MLLMTYLTVFSVSQEPSKHYTYQAVHIYDGLHKWFRQQLTPRGLLFLGLLEKHPANVHPFSLHHLLILGRQRTLVSKHPACCMSRYLMGYVLCCLFNSELVHTFTPFSTAVDSQNASLASFTCASSQKTDSLNMGQKSTLVLWIQLSAQLRKHHLIWEETSTIQTCIQMFCHWLSISFQCYLRPLQAVHILQGKNVNDIIISLFC